MFYDRDLPISVDLGHKPLWFQLQVNVDLVMWNVLCCHYQSHSLDARGEKREEGGGGRGREGEKGEGGREGGREGRWASEHNTL